MKLFGVELLPLTRWKFQLVWWRFNYRLKIWWRLKLPQTICELNRKHRWEPTADWGYTGRICTRCLKKIYD